MAPMLPPAPGRFSTTTCCLRPSDIALATERASTSEEPPGANVTMSRIGPVGYCWASAPDAKASAANAANISVRRVRVMSSSVGGSQPIYIAAAVGCTTHVSRAQLCAKRPDRNPLSAQPRLLHQRQSLVLELAHLLLVARPGQQHAVEPGLGQRRERVDDLLLGADDGKAGPAADEVARHLVQNLLRERRRVDAERRDQRARRLPVAVLVDVIAGE